MDSYSPRSSALATHTRPAPLTPAAADVRRDVGPAEAALASAVAGATVGRDTATVALRAAVGGYTRALMAQGALPTHAVLAVERVMQVAGVPRFGTAADAALTAQAVAWCVEEYHPTA